MLVAKTWNWSMARPLSSYIQTWDKRVKYRWRSNTKLCICEYVHEHTHTLTHTYVRARWEARGWRPATKLWAYAACWLWFQRLDNDTRSSGRLTDGGSTPRTRRPLHIISRTPANPAESLRQLLPRCSRRQNEAGVKCLRLHLAPWTTTTPFWSNVHRSFLVNIWCTIFF